MDWELEPEGIKMASAITSQGKTLEHLQRSTNIDTSIKTREEYLANQSYQYYLMQHINENVKLANDAAIDDETINLVTGHGFVEVNYNHIVFWENGFYQQLKVVGVSGDQITLEEPLSMAFTTNAKVIRGNIHLNVNGSGTPVKFEMTPIGNSYGFDIATIILTMQSGNNVPDDGKFGGLAEVPNGIYVRLYNQRNIWLGNYVKNADFKHRGASVIYDDSAPAGTNATTITFDFDKLIKRLLRIDPGLGNQFYAIVRDDLTGLADFKFSFFGPLSGVEA